ncbi:MAG: DUF4038 domain-containing protein [Firmicutes bacterium]|nr:DUF4038 domain-containing protein [Bacillota bacterium]
MTVEYRSVYELSVISDKVYDNPFIDVELWAVFAGPNEQEYHVFGFYDGQGVWRVRFSPAQVGAWTYKLVSYPHDPNLEKEGEFQVVPATKETRGFLKTRPDQYWGFEYENGEPCFLFGDTVYNLFGIVHCGYDVKPFLERRVNQGFNILRVRSQVSPFHPPQGHSKWQNRSTWPWGGIPQIPQFDRFNLDYFRSVDKAVDLAQQLGMGLEIILQAWGFEYPFNARNVFLPEYELLWTKYWIARYDAYTSVYVWTLMNEYEFYPDGIPYHRLIADLWAQRMARWVKDTAPHGHPVAVHNWGGALTPFAERFARCPDLIDLVMFQYWGDGRGSEASLAVGIEEKIEQCFEGWTGARVLSEYGYERNPELDLNIPSHEYMDVDHTRRGAWRGAFTATCVIHGFENTWGPWLILDKDQEGMHDLLVLHRFFTEMVPFEQLRPAAGLITKHPIGGKAAQARCLASEDNSIVTVYLPLGGAVGVALDCTRAYSSHWYDPTTGKMRAASYSTDGLFHAPSVTGSAQDWVLVLDNRTTN